MTTFETPNYIIGNSASITTSLSTVLTTLDQALQALQPAPSATIVKFNNTVRCDNGTSRVIDMNNGDITSVDGGVGTMTYIPSFVLPASSNQAIQIPPFSQNPHQIILESAPVPLIDTLEAQPYPLPSVEQVNCFGVNTNTNDMYLGCESGNILWFNVATTSWDLLMTMNGSVRCLYFHSNSGRMYIGFKGDSMVYPSYQGNLNYICYSTAFPSLYPTLTTDTWSNYGINGFNTVVNAVAGDGTYLYFGGEFDYDYNNNLNCKKLAIYDWNATGNLYAIDGSSGTGVDDIVYGLSLISDKLCITGMFQTVFSNMGSLTARYCVCLTMIAGYILNSMEYLFGDPTALSTPIDIYDSVKGDGSVFWISTKDNIIASNLVNYMIQAPNYSFSSSSVVGYNQCASPQTSYNLQGTIGSVGADQVYLKFGETQATLTFQPYIYWNYTYGRQEFINLGNGAIYAFTGSTSNPFYLQNSRTINYSGNTYFTGWSITPTGNGFGYSSTLLWNGSYYIPTSMNGGSPV
jgi:hypothetical protein